MLDEGHHVSSLFNSPGAWRLQQEDHRTNTARVGVEGKKGYRRMDKEWLAFHLTLIHDAHNPTYLPCLCLLLLACECARARARACVCMGMFVYACVRACVCVYVRARVCGAYARAHCLWVDMRLGDLFLCFFCRYECKYCHRRLTGARSLWRDVHFPKRCPRVIDYTRAEGDVVCVCVCVCVCTLRMCVCVCVCVSVCLYACMHVCMYVCMYACMPTDFFLFLFFFSLLEKMSANVSRHSADFFFFHFFLADRYPPGEGDRERGLFFFI